MPNNKSIPLKPGTKFNYLTIIKYSHQDKRWRRFYLCKCNCGKEKIIQGSLMISGNTKSCGCLRKEVRQLSRLPNDLAVKRQIIFGYKRHAKDRNISYNISENDFIKLLSKDCYYCGLIPSNIRKTKNHTGFVYSGIDRVDSNKGYTKENCVACCEQCNKAKSNITKDEFAKWIKRVYNAMANQWG